MGAGPTVALLAATRPLGVGRFGIGNLAVDRIRVAGERPLEANKTASKGFLIPFKGAFGHENVEDRGEHLLMYRPERPRTQKGIIYTPRD